MTNTYNLNGPSNWFGSLTRALMVGCAAIAGLFMLAISAAFAFFVVAAIAIIGFLAFAFLWGRAKILGKPFGPRAHFEAKAKEMQKDLGMTFTPQDHQDGPIIDAKQTPDGWSVDE